MKQKSSIAAKYLFCQYFDLQDRFLYQAELLNLHRLRFCLLLYRSFQWIFSCHENTALHRTTRSASEVAHLILTTKGQLPLKILQIFFFQITCQDILFGAKLAQKSLCFGFLICLYCLSQYLSVKLKRLYRRFTRVSAVFYLLRRIDVSLPLFIYQKACRIVFSVCEIRWPDIRMSAKDVALFSSSLGSKSVYDSL